MKEGRSSVGENPLRARGRGEHGHGPPQRGDLRARSAPYDRRRHGVRVDVCVCAPDEVAGADLACTEDFFDRGTESERGRPLAEMIEHQGAAEDEGRGVGPALARDVRDRAVDGLEDRQLVTDVGAGDDPQPADQARALLPSLLRFPASEFTQHIPPKDSHLIRYYGWYSNKSRGTRKKAEAEAPDEPSSEEAAATGSSQSWAMLIKRVYEVGPLCCPECGGQMQVESFIEPPQADVIEEILKHCGLWQSWSPRAPAHRRDGCVSNVKMSLLALIAS